MKLTKKGIGWLILGVLMCLASTDSGSLSEAAGMIFFGLVFILVYLIKQAFDPRGTGWFVMGGILIAYSVECMLGIIGGLLGSYVATQGETSDVMIGLICAAVCMYVFYVKNRTEIDEVADEMGMGVYSDHMKYQQEVFRDAGDEIEQAGDETGQVGDETEQTVDDEIVFEIESVPEEPSEGK